MKKKQGAQMPVAGSLPDDGFVKKLLAWYARNGRDLPWRGTHDPYRIWLSEIILQQTRVVQGWDYYERFLRRFPDVKALAAADEDEVLLLWQGLGYYSRARNLHAAARQIVSRGSFPNTYEELRQLRGVGDYTAAAIASFAYGHPCAVVDGNVYRVLARHFGISTPIDTTAGHKAFAQLANMLLYSADSATYNQALMDFGAMQCTPQSPLCAECPLAVSCYAYEHAAWARFPVKSKRTALRTRHFVYLYLRLSRGGGVQVYLHRRPAGDIWQGLYEPFLLEFDHAPSLDEVLGRQPLPPGSVLRQVATGMRHVLTHQELVADCYEVNLESPMELPGHILVDESLLNNYAAPRLVCRLYEKLTALRTNK